MQTQVCVCVCVFQTLARHVMNVHLSAQAQTEGVEGEIPLATYKKYIAYARA